MTVSFADLLYPLVTTGDAVGAWDLLAGLEGKELTEARAWFAKATRWYGMIPEGAFRQGSDSTANHDAWSESHRIMALCAVELSGPATAAKRVPWDMYWWHQKCVGDELFVDAVCAKDPAWVADFVEAASQRTGDTVGRVLRNIGERVPLPCPAGRGYTPAWQRYPVPEDLAGEIAADAWMPEALYRFLDNGECGKLPELPEAIRVLADRGVVERARMIMHILGLLTSPQRPASQQVLVRILEALDVRPEDLPGLDYVLSVMATSVGVVGKYLLPLAMQLVTAADDLTQLTSTVAGRQEKGLKQTLLKALQGNLRSRVGDEAAGAALAVLSTDEDASFAATVAAVISKLGLSAPPAQEQQFLGLWALEPTWVPESERPVFKRWGRVRWSALLNKQETDEPTMQCVLVTELLSSLAERGADAVAEFRDPTLALLSLHSVRMSRLAEAVSDLFLAGGLRYLWATALDIADREAREAVPAAGFADVLRTLTRFAPEVPCPELPYGIAALAASKGTTTAQMQARALGAALARTDADAFTESVRANPPRPQPKPYRGLWHPTEPDLAIRDAKLAPIPADSYVELLSLQQLFHSPSHYPLCVYPPNYPKAKEGNVWLAEQLLSETVRMVREDGVAKTRAKIVDIERTLGPVGTVIAIDLWASGQLTPELFWRLTMNGRTYFNHHLPTPFPWGRVGDCPWFDRAVRQEPTEQVALPPWVDEVTTRLEFFRAMETLLVADRSPVVLSTPVYADGTLDFDDLLARLEQAPGPVALLDVIQALYRLRRCAPSRAEEVPLDRWWTDPALTTPEGGIAHDAGRLLRTWVSANGMPKRLPAVLKLHNVSASAPVPWSISVIAKSMLARGHEGTGLDILKFMPLAPDLVVPITPGLEPERFPVGAHWPWGPRMHDAAMDLLAQPAFDEEIDWLPIMLPLIQAERFDPSLVARRGITAGMAYAFERVFEAGGLGGAWPLAMAVALSSLKPYSTADRPSPFIDLLLSYAHEVPDHQIPEALQAFADLPVDDSLHTQVRRLVAALERP